MSSSSSTTLNASPSDSSTVSAATDLDFLEQEIRNAYMEILDAEAHMEYLEKDMRRLKKLYDDYADSPWCDPDIRKLMKKRHLFNDIPILSMEYKKEAHYLDFCRKLFAQLEERISEAKNNT